MIEPEPGEDWSDVDGRYDPSKRMTLVDQYTANTDPNDPQSIFRILSLQAAPFVTLHFHTAPDRLHRLQSTLDLARPETWANVPGAVLSGHGGPASVMDTNQPPLGTSYRLPAWRFLPRNGKVHARRPDHAPSRAGPLGCGTSAPGSPSQEGGSRDGLARIRLSIANCSGRPRGA